MSWFHQTDVRCPKCGEDFQAPTAQTVNVTRMPDARSWVPPSRERENRGAAMRMTGVARVSVMALIALISLAPPVSAETPPAVEEALRASLAGESGAQTAEARVDPGPLGLRVVTVAIPDAYPGTGVRRAVVDGTGRAYGRHLDRGLADLARDAGWLDSPPAPADLVRVLNVTDFDGLLIADDPALTPVADGLELRFVKREPFDPEARTPMTARIPRAGPLSIEKQSVAPQPTPALTGTAALQKALDAGSPVEILQAMRAVAADPAALPLLARATRSESEAVAVEAISRIPATDAGAAALRAAWRGLGAAEKARLVGFARELHGEAFAAGL